MQAFLARKAQNSFGILIRIPHQLSGEAEAHLIDMLHSMLKVCFVYTDCMYPFDINLYT